MRKLIILAIIAVIVPCLVFVTGCEEQQPIKDKRVRLVANQNLELKKQLLEKDAEIERQKGLVADCQNAKEEQKLAHDRSAEGMLNIMKSISQQATQVEQLTAENEQLKAKIAELEGK